jgi:hypothetical protein
VADANTKSAAMPDAFTSHHNTYKEHKMHLTTNNEDRMASQRSTKPKCSSRHLAALSRTELYFNAHGVSVLETTRFAFVPSEETHTNPLQIITPFTC